MSFGAKIVVTIAVGFVLCAVGVVGLAALLWSRHGGAMVEATQKQGEQGSAFGRETDEAGCLNEAVSRYKVNRGFAGSMSTSIFVGACFQTSAPTAGFCDRVPKPFDVLAGARWQTEQARKAGIDETFGVQIFNQMRVYCDLKRQRTPKPLSPR
jgi:hypothetical protein